MLTLARLVVILLPKGTLRVASNGPPAQPLPSDLGIFPESIILNIAKDFDAFGISHYGAERCGVVPYLILVPVPLSHAFLFCGFLLTLFFDPVLFKRTFQEWFSGSQGVVMVYFEPDTSDIDGDLPQIVLLLHLVCSDFVTKFWLNMLPLDFLFFLLFFLRLFWLLLVRLRLPKRIKCRRGLRQAHLITIIADL